MSSSTENQGEGNRKAADQYNEATKEFVKTEDVSGKAKEARDALDSAEGSELRSAEEKGKQKAHEEDPQVHRDR